MATIRCAYWAFAVLLMLATCTECRLVEVGINEAAHQDPRYADCSTCSCYYSPGGDALDFQANALNVTDSSCQKWCDDNRPSKCKWNKYAGGGGQCEAWCGYGFYGSKECSVFTQSECDGQQENGPLGICPLPNRGARSKTCLDRVTCSCNYLMEFKHIVMDKVVDQGICERACKGQPDGSSLNVTAGCVGDCVPVCPKFHCSAVSHCQVTRDGCGAAECNCLYSGAQVGWKYNPDW